MFRHLVLGTILAGAIPLAAQAVVFGNQQSHELAQQGLKLVISGNLTEAREKLLLAVKADPTASYPVSGLGMLYFVLSSEPSLSEEQRKNARREASAAVAQAIALDAQDPLAQEVSRKLTGGAQQSRYQPAGNAGQLAQQGEVLFSKKDFKAALEKYAQAIAADPNYADAWVFAGDCYFSMQQWQEAETRFRKATELEPLHEQAWRFLSDALYKQQKWPEMELALAAAIGAYPDQVTAWQRMGQFQRQHGVPLTPLDLKVKGRGGVDEKGGARVQLDGSQLKGPEWQVDTAFWTQVAMSQAAGAIRAKETGNGMTAFQIELAAWRNGFLMLQKREEKTGQPALLHDAALQRMRQLNDAGELEAALLLLQFKEAYRPELEAWKLAHPNGVRQFVNTYHLMP